MKVDIKEKIFLIIIIVVGFFLRFYGINWDQTCCQHPDERAIVMFALPIDFPKSTNEFFSVQSPLNPHFFAYGNFPLYLLKEVSVFAGKINIELSQYQQIDLVGRSISIISDLLTIILIYLIGKLIFNKKIGLASSFIYSFSVLPIQYSHFYTSDILLTMFVILTIYRLLKLYQNPNSKNSIAVGLSFGLALATKISAIPLAVAIGAALAADFLFIFIQSPHKPKKWLPHLPRFLIKLATDGLLIAATTVITFIVLQPYSIIDKDEFLTQNLQQSQMTHNAYIFPYTLQYVGKIPYIYELKNIFLWGLGPIISILCITGIFFVLDKIKKTDIKKRTEIFILFIFSIAYFAVVGKFAVGFMRYMLPIYPALALLAGISICEVYIKLSKLNTFVRSVLLVAGFLLVIIWPLSYLSIYSKENTRIEASSWIHQNIPNGSTLATEHWDDRLPMGDSSEYNFEELQLYNQPDDMAKWSIVNNQLAKSNYIIIASNRLYIPLQKLADCNKFKECYPLASEYYKKLFAGRMGFHKIAEFSSYPTVPLLGLKINDTSADESFTVYDHPTIFVFKKN